ncbi:MAG: RNA 2',3'-cyclic phosphodiesterase [Candidatus Micrarchaeaceae archaeon]
MQKEIWPYQSDTDFYFKFQSTYMRAFYAIDLDEKVRDSIYEFEKKLEGNMKKVEKENIHITILFLGEQDEESIDKLKRVRLDEEEFQCRIGKLGTFGGRFRSVIFLEIDEGKEKIKKIYESLSTEVSSLGIKFEKERDFVPHITLARAKGRFSVRGEKEDFGSFVVKSIKLKKSVITKNGPSYFDIAEIPLRKV